MQFEPLEQRRLLSAVPIIETATAEPSPLTRGLKLAITATASDSDGTVKSVDFFVDTNANGTWDPDTDKRVARDGTPGNGFVGNVSTQNTKKLPTGPVVFFVIANDNSKDKSDPAPVTVQVENSAPTIKNVVLAPKKLKQGKKLNINATGLKDVDGKVASASFFQDENANGTIEVGTDTLVGTDTDSKGGFKITLESDDTTGLALGEHTILAQVTDTDGGTSNVVSSVLTVTEPASTGGGGGTDGTDLTILNVLYNGATFSSTGSNQILNYTVRARNLGNDASLGYGYEVHFSTDTIFGNSDDRLVDTVEGAPLAGRQTRNDADTVDLDTIGLPLAPGSYYVLVKIDAGDTITESNEVNNVFNSGTANIIVT